LAWRGLRTAVACPGATAAVTATEIVWLTASSRPLRSRKKRRTSGDPTAPAGTLQRRVKDRKVIRAEAKVCQSAGGDVDPVAAVTPDTPVVPVVPVVPTGVSCSC